MINKLVVEEETKRLMTEGGKTGLPRKTARLIARRKVANSQGYQIGQLGKSKFSTTLSRSERRKISRELGCEFKPKYNGNEPKTYEEVYNVDYKRFNNKYITVKQQ
ncbi:hypothetical protein NST17_20195 [Caldifermentibacillus hisashii]|uniref:Phage protein n=1 Tax=Caldifermentibacillus hisashii TaxID=996558 RepID=A0ABU9K618_9BACI